jgi:hypothetical protein
LGAKFPFSLGYFKWSFGEVLEEGNIFGCCWNAKRLCVSRKVNIFSLCK